jgi:hypothetical protein
MMTEQEVNAWAVTVPGFKQNDANAALITGYMQSKNLLPVTPERLTKAVNDLGSLLEWEPEFEPKAPAAAATRKKRDAFNEMIDAGAGAPRRTDSHTDLASGDRAKEAEARHNAFVAEQRAAADAVLQHEEENVIVWYGSGDRINHGETQRARSQAKARWAAHHKVEYVSDAIAAIPLNSTPQELKPFSSAQIKHWMKRRREAGLPV